MYLVWLKFIICALVIFFAGSKLTLYGDAIAEKTGLSRAWIGLVLLASITSLPELANSISAVTVAQSPDLAVGDLLGACMINMFTLALLDIFSWLTGRKSIFINPMESNKLSSFFGIGLLIVASLGLALSRTAFDYQVFGISIYTAIIFLLYLVAQRYIFKHSESTELAAESEKNYAHLPSARVYLFFGLSALAVVLAGSWLPFIGNEIVSVMGWGKTFVAVLFLALATTLPEMTVSASALKLGAVGMSIGNLVGSNIFNVAVLFIADIFYRPGSILAAVSPNMLYPAVFGTVLLFVVYVSLKKQITNRIPSISIFLIYVISMFILYRLGIF
jgi:cation:H+ antiporter